MKKRLQLPLLASVLVAVCAFQAGCSSGKADPPAPASEAANGEEVRLISASSQLVGLPKGALFPFIDTTPNTITRAHVAITDAPSSCAGATAPTNVKVLVGQAGVFLVNVMTAAANTGISTPAGQCVFHVTVTPGQIFPEGVVPDTVTDIVVLNASSSAALTAINTVTASATVRVKVREND